MDYLRIIEELIDVYGERERTSNANDIESGKNPALAERVSELHDRAREEQEQERWKEALLLYLDLLQLKPDHSIAWLQSGICLLKDNSYELAERVFSALITADPQSLPARLKYAQSAHLQKHWRIALERWDEALRLQADNKDAIYKKGECFLQLGNFREAEENFLACMERYPDFIPAHQSFAHSAQRQQNWRVALERWQSIIETFPENTRALAAKGHILLQLRCFGDAVKIFTHLRDAYPTEPHGLAGLAEAYMSLSDWNKALNLWKTLSEAFPENLYYRVAQGSTLMDLERFDEAASLFLELSEQYPDNPEILAGLFSARRQQPRSSEETPTTPL
jgi:tetratricopeptide (TPR) repeat protein